MEGISKSIFHDLQKNHLVRKGVSKEVAEVKVSARSTAVDSPHKFLEEKSQWAYRFESVGFSVNEKSKMINALTNLAMKST